MLNFIVKIMFTWSWYTWRQFVSWVDCELGEFVREKESYSVLVFRRGGDLVRELQNSDDDAFTKLLMMDIALFYVPVSECRYFTVLLKT